MQATSHRYAGLVILAGLISTGFAGTLSPAARADDGVPWLHDLEQAKKVAAQTNRLVLVHFYGSNCPPCAQLDREVFSQKHVAAALAANYVPVKINVDHALPLASQYGVDRWPTEVILTPGGQVVTKFTSPQGPTAYVARMDQVALVNKASTSGQFAQTGMNPYLNLAGASATATGTQPLGANLPANAPPGSTSVGASGNPWATQAGGGSAGGQTQLVGNDSVVGDRYATPAAPNYSQGAPAYSPPTYSAPSATAQPNLPQGQAGAPQGYDRYAAQAGQAFAGTPAGNGGPGYAPPATTAGTPANPSGYQDRYATQPAPGSNPQPANYDRNAQQPPAQDPYSPPVAQHQHNPYAPSAGALGDPAAAQAAAQGTASGLNGVGPQAFAPAQPATPPASYHPNQVASPQAPQMQTNSYAQPQYAQQPAAPPMDPALAGRPLTAPQPEAQFGLDGYCAVTLSTQQKWVKGDRRWGAIHMGRTYLFIGANEQKEFLANPDRYSPVLAGNDPVLMLEKSMHVPGQRSFGVFYRNNVYLFSGQESLARFEKAPDRYAAGVRQAMQASQTQRR